MPKIRYFEPKSIQDTHSEKSVIHYNLLNSVQEWLLDLGLVFFNTEEPFFLEFSF